MGEIEGWAAARSYVDASNSSDNRNPKRHQPRHPRLRLAVFELIARPGAGESGGVSRLVIGLQHKRLKNYAKFAPRESCLSGGGPTRLAEGARSAIRPLGILGIAESSVSDRPCQLNWCSLPVGCGSSRTGRYGKAHSARDDRQSAQQRGFSWLPIWMTMAIRSHHPRV